MSGIESIKNKIEADGAAESEQMLAAAKAEAARIKRDNEIKIAELKSQTEAKVAAVRAQKQRIAASNASLAVRKEMLAAKKELIDRVCDEAVKRIAGFGSADYEKAVLGLFSQCTIEGGEQILLSENAKAKLGDGIVEKMNAALSGKKVALGASTSEITDGFIVQGKNSRQVCTFEAALELDRDRIEAQIAKILFE
ncbi:MAG TPA: V-type ATP synthase subunit E family protein [Oscillospiraceae bacterium]|nr:V-type ATP synthase subunit E family protein [Oscillospiraceae bacterium]HPF56969.1 V-type ATP synthase subunit E family protein [Clostridiales bacterium]HPK34802.1 V-type ATP synthase subunit E family protein [Oscillospiraceae bacterium]HPR75852.1 V-type ATP synthase subunit E family protein [Oscillospiraceae bacterium]